ncbi:MAG: phosphoglycerate kinase [Firmicutes bacterium]|nr:phosphoglycerate kinase [Bacillota bacterium]
MKYFKDSIIENKKVILRCDLNVTIKDNVILDDTKIIKSLDTINYLLNNNNSIIILSHLGKVKTEEDKIKNTLYPVYLKLKELINTNIYFSEYTSGEELKTLSNKLKEKEILLVENTRHEDLIDKKESKCNDELSKYWASLGEVFINDAFGTSHRCHASNYGIKKYLPTYYGSLINEEKNKLDELINNPEKPFLVVMGGAKVEDKLMLISELLPICDNLIVGGGIANTFIHALGYNVGKSLLSLENVDEIKELINKYKEKIIIPIDFYVSYNDSKEYRNLDELKDEDIIFDIGEKTIEKYSEIINNSNTVFINGTVGLYENKDYEYGTKTLLEKLSNSNAKVFVGGGDAVTATNKLGFNNTFYYKSTGGGATLEYIINKNMSALED